MSKPSIIRQVVDLQAQSERLIRTGGNIPEIEAFAKYNQAVKAYLLEHIEDEFVLQYVRTIPSVQLEEVETKSNIITFLLSLISGGSASTYQERDQIERALKQIKEVSNKYSSYEMMIRNCLEE